MQYHQKKKPRKKKRKFKIPSYPSWGYQPDNFLTQYIERLNKPKNKGQLPKIKK